MGHPDPRSPPSPPAPVSVGLRLAALPRFAVTWLVLASADTLLFALTPGTAWGDPWLFSEGRIGLVFDGILSAMLLAVLVMAASVAMTLARAEQGSRRAPRLIARTLCVAIVGVAMFLYASSWASFRSTTQFLDVDGLSFWLMNPLLVLRYVGHMEPATIVLVPLAAAALTAVLLLAAARARQLDRRIPRLGWMLGAFAVVLSYGACTADRNMRDVPIMLRDKTSGIPRPYAEHYAELLRDRSGPVVHVLSVAWRAVSASSDLPSASPDVLVTRRPILAPGAYSASVDTTRMHRWNVLVVLLESARADQLSMFGGERVVMPALDSLAGESRRFTSAYTPASHTNYAAPTALSSAYPLRSAGQYIYPKTYDYPRVFLYSLLKPLGYRTAIFSSDDDSWGGQVDYFNDGTIDHYAHAGTPGMSRRAPRNDAGIADALGATGFAGTTDDHVTIDAAIRWIDTSGGIPFFASVKLQNSHFPYDRPAAFAPRFGSGKVAFPLRYASFPSDSVRAVKDLYANSLAYDDAELARLFAHLRTAGLWDSTVVVVLSDHGEAFFEHGFASHANALFDEAMRVPLIVHAPGLASATDSLPASSIDVAPTVLHLLGLPPHPAFQGIDLLGATTPATRRDRPIFAVTQSPLAHQAAVVQGGWKLIYDERRRRYALYDLASDPGEHRDLSVAQPEKREALAKVLDTWRRVQIDYYANRNLHARWYPPVVGPRVRRSSGRTASAFPTKTLTTSGVGQLSLGQSCDDRASFNSVLCWLDCAIPFARMRPYLAALTAPCSWVRLLR